MNFEEQIERGYELLKEKKYDETLDVARDLQFEEPDAAEGYHLEAMVQQRKKQWEHSIKSLNKAIEIDPENSGLYNLRGYAYLNTEKLSKAEADFSKAIEMDDLAAAHRNLVLHKLMSNNGTEAINYLLQQIKKNPRDVENWILMGDLMQRGGHDDKARSYYEQANKMDPDNEYVKRQLAEKH